MNPAIYVPPESESPGLNRSGHQRPYKNDSSSNSSTICLGLLISILIVVGAVYIFFDRMERVEFLNRIKGQ